MQCAVYKGRGFCGKQCPILSKLRVETREINNKKEFEGSSPPTIFIGSKLEYPNVNVGIMSLPEIKDNAWLYDSPNHWSQKEISSNQIIQFRQSLINSRFQAKVSDIRRETKLLSLAQEIGMASIKADVEVKLEKKPSSKISFSEDLLPIGPSAQLKKIELITNPKIPSFVEKVYFDTDLKSVEALQYLYKKGLDEHSLSQLLSIGITGLKKNRRLVPTRNSITAIDEIIAKELMKEIRKFPSINEYLVFESQYLDNHFIILMMPGNWEFENFEAWAPGSIWSSSLKNAQILEEYESFHGRTKYAEREGGGYYASRTACVEKLKNMRRQAQVVAFREIYKGYVIPLGVFVVRETAKKAYKNKPIAFSIKQEALTYINSKLRLNINEYIKKSRILQQKKLNDFAA